MQRGKCARTGRMARMGGAGSLRLREGGGNRSEGLPRAGYARRVRCPRPSALDSLPAYRAPPPGTRWRGA